MEQQGQHRYEAQMEAGGGQQRPQAQAGALRWFAIGQRDTDSDTKPLKPGSVQNSGAPAAVAPA